MIFLTYTFLSNLLQYEFDLIRSTKHQDIGFNQNCIQIDPNTGLKKYFLLSSINKIALKLEKCLILPCFRSWFYHMNVLKSGFFGSIMKLPCIFYKLGQRNTEKCEKFTLGVLRQKSTKTAIVWCEFMIRPVNVL